MSEKLIIFVRAPRLGEVKQRLAKAIGPKAALHAYEMLGARLLQNLALLKNVELRITPDSARDEAGGWLKSGWSMAVQGDGDLGARLTRAFQESFAARIERVVIIGSDCPAVLADDIQTAWRSLLTHDVALGPASDGGYWLIGLRQPAPQLFEDVPWSTASVTETTLRRIRDAKLTVQCLRTLSDIDTVEDWNEFCRKDGQRA